MLSNKEAVFKNINFILLSILFLFPLLPNALQSIAIGLFVLSTLILYRKSFVTLKTNLSWKPFFICTGWFLLLALTILYSFEKGKGGDNIVRGLSLVLFPLVILYFFPQLTLKKKQVLIYCYLGAYIFLVFYLYHKVVEGVGTIGYLDEAGNRIMNFSEDSSLDQFRRILDMPFSLSRYYLNENNISSFFIHKAYLSMGYVWGIFLMTYILIKEPVKSYHKGILIVISLLFSIMVIYFTSIPNLFALLIILPIYIFILLGDTKKRMLFVGSAVLVLSILSQTSYVQDKVLKDERLVNGVLETKRMAISIINNAPTDGSNIRVEVWKCAYKIIPKRIFFGYGIGSEGKVLKDCYDSANCSVCSEYTFNAHNQYATFVISGGLVVLLVFLCGMFYSIRLAYMTSNWLYFSFLLLFLVNLISESMLVRIHGVLFYAIFNSIFFAESYNEMYSKKALNKVNS